MNSQFFVTYETVTPESAEHGLVDERGFVVNGGYHYPVEEGHQCGLSLRDAVSLICCRCDDAGSWFYEVDSRINFRTGAEERRSLHPPRAITASSYARLKRLLCSQ